MSLTDALTQLTELAKQTPDNALLTAALTDLIHIFTTSDDTRDHKLATQSLSELNRSIQAFLPYRDTRKVAVFGSARTQPDHPDYHLAKAVSQALVTAGFLIITGAGDGIMAAGNAGAGPDKSFGLNIELPFEQAPNDYIRNSDKLIQYNYFFLRKLFFVRESDATVLLPGGFGTQDEGFELITLLQTGRCDPRPLVLLDHAQSDYWDNWLAFIDDNLNKTQLISPDDMQLIYKATDAADACRYITQFYHCYHSVTYRNNQAIIYLNYALQPDVIHDLKHIISPSVRYTAPTASEKATIAYDFDLNYGKLNASIIQLNRRLNLC